MSQANRSVVSPDGLLAMANRADLMRAVDV